MPRFNIGVMVDSFRLPIADGVRKARELGADGIQVYVVEGDMRPEQMDAARRRDFVALVRDNGLEIAALCGDLGGHGFQIPAEIRSNSVAPKRSSTWLWIWGRRSSPPISELFRPTRRHRPIATN